MVPARGRARLVGPAAALRSKNYRRRGAGAGDDERARRHEARKAAVARARAVAMFHVKRIYRCASALSEPPKCCSAAHARASHWWPIG